MINIYAISAKVSYLSKQNLSLCFVLLVLIKIIFPTDHFNVQATESFSYLQNEQAEYTDANNSDKDRFESVPNNFLLIHNNLRLRG